MIRKMTVYELNKAFTQTLSLFYSASLGNIQRAVKILAARGVIEGETIYHGKRRKIVYRITATGREEFLASSLESIPSARLESTALARVSFLGLVESSHRVRVLAVIIDQIERSLSELKVLERTLQDQEIPEGTQRLFEWQMKPLAYGIQSHQMALDWFTELKRDSEERGVG